MARLMLLGGDGGRSGVPRHLRHLSAALRDHHQITVVSEPDRGGYGFCAEMGLRHHALPGLRSALDPCQGLRAARALRDLIAEDKPDLVWAHARMALPVARWALRAGGPRLAVTYHGLPFGPGHGVLRAALSRAVEALTLPLVVPQDLIFLTEEDLAAFPARLRRRHRTHVLQNTSDLGGAPVPARSGPLRLAMLTRPGPQKNLELAASLLPHLPGVELHLWGEGTDTPDLRARLMALAGAAAGRLRFGGVTDQPARVLANSDGLLVSSRYEGLSIAAIEAMEAGRPVISTEVGGAGMLARCHPAFCLIRPETEGLAACGARAMRVLQAFRADPAGQTAAIHAAWQTEFAPDRWAGRVRDLVAEMSGRR